MKTIAVFGSILLLLIAGAAAFMGGSGRYGMGQGMQGAWHERMEGLMEDGSYADLQELRQELGFPMMSWVQSEADFVAMQQRHGQMEKIMEQRGGCPMHG